MSAVLEVRGVSKSFRIPASRRETVREHALDLFRPRAMRDLRVLDEIDLVVERGERIAIMGRNGSGKSTLLKIVAGIYPPDRGEIVRHAAITPILELGVGWSPELDAVDNIYLLGAVMGMTLPEIDEAVDGILDFAELGEFAGMKLKYYSSGMGARLAYAVAFRAVREVLLLDEIFAVGDYGFKEKCQAHYGQLHAEGRTILLVSHEPSIVLDFCDRGVLIDDGHILEDGPIESVVETYKRLLA